ncbi:MAG: anaerobic ribonucleoside-triphosphate reductase activating protein [Clostridia bacterium]|nr:anaerobic ribonucleoside-triphosphate reductase activating protein [Clostridia bacterium]
MNVGGFLKQSFIDYPGTICAVIFTSGCNFKCWYCHNSQLINDASSSQISLAEIYDFLKSRKKFLEGVVISGGEPTLQADLKEVARAIKQLGYKVKLDTNGSNPQVLQSLLDENLIDYVAMDIKTCLRNYNEIINTYKDFSDELKKSIEIIKNSKVDYEFRTTFSPDISLGDIKEIADLAKDSKAFYLQKYTAENAPCGSSNITLMPHSRKTFDDALTILKTTIPSSKIRGL